jgi:hypothetical protein
MTSATRNRASMISILATVSFFMLSCECCSPFLQKSYNTNSFAEFFIESSDFTIAPYFVTHLSDGPGDYFFDSPSENPFYAKMGDWIPCYIEREYIVEKYDYYYKSCLCNSLSLKMKIQVRDIDVPIDASSPAVQELTWKETTHDPGITGDPTGETEYRFESVRSEGQITFLSFSPVVEAVFDLWFYDAGGNYRHLSNGWLWAEHVQTCIGVG